MNVMMRLPSSFGSENDVEVEESLRHVQDEVCRYAGHDRAQSRHKEEDEEDGAHEDRPY